MSPELTAIGIASIFILATLLLLMWIVASARTNTDLDETQQERIERERLPIPRYTQGQRP